MWISGVLIALVVTTRVPDAHAYLRKPPYANNTRPGLWYSATQLAERLGWDLESHEIITEDGYVLTTHRVVPRPLISGGPPTTKKKAPVNNIPLLAGHGLASSSEQWLAVDKHGLVFILAEMGFDVWLANYRGSFYSRSKHVSLDRKSQEFWDFSWHENGVYDQAANIDYILNVTERDSVLVLGHSMSSTAQVVLLAERPDYNAKVRASLLLAPPVYFKYPAGINQMATQLYRIFPFLQQSTARHVINDRFPGLDKPFPQACFKSKGNVPEFEPHCRRSLPALLGPWHTPLDMDGIYFLLHHHPNGASIRQLGHYAQCINAGGRFQKYDFGAEKNTRLYRNPVAPVYNLSRITSPVYVHYSHGDGTVNYRDVENFAKDLPPGTLRRLRKIPAPIFNHADFIVATEVYHLLYKYVIEDLLKHATD